MAAATAGAADTAAAAAAAGVEGGGSGRPGADGIRSPPLGGEGREGREGREGVAGPAQRDADGVTIVSRGVGKVRQKKVCVVSRVSAAVVGVCWRDGCSSAVIVGDITPCMYI